MDDVTEDEFSRYEEQFPMLVRAARDNVKGGMQWAGSGEAAEILRTLERVRNTVGANLYKLPLLGDAALHVALERAMAPLGYELVAVRDGGVMDFGRERCVLVSLRPGMATPTRDQAMTYTEGLDRFERRHGEPPMTLADITAASVESNRRLAGEMDRQAAERIAEPIQEVGKRRTGPICHACGFPHEYGWCHEHGEYHK